DLPGDLVRPALTRLLIHRLDHGIHQFPDELLGGEVGIDELLHVHQEARAQPAEGLGVGRGAATGGLGQGGELLLHPRQEARGELRSLEEAEHRARLGDRDVVTAGTQDVGHRLHRGVPQRAVGILRGHVVEGGEDLLDQPGGLLRGALLRPVLGPALTAQASPSLVVGAHQLALRLREREVAGLLLGTQPVEPRLLFGLHGGRLVGSAHRALADGLGRGRGRLLSEQSLHPGSESGEELLQLTQRLRERGVAAGGDEALLLWALRPAVALGGRSGFARLFGHSTGILPSTGWGPTWVLRGTGRLPRPSVTSTTAANTSAAPARPRIPRTSLPNPTPSAMATTGFT